MHESNFAILYFFLNSCSNFISFYWFIILCACLKPPYMILPTYWRVTTKIPFEILRTISFCESSDDPLLSVFGWSPFASFCKTPLCESSDNLPNFLLLTNSFYFLPLYFPFFRIITGFIPSKCESLRSFHRTILIKASVLGNYLQYWYALTLKFS